MLSAKLWLERGDAKRVVARVGSAPHPFDARIAAPSPELPQIRSVRR